MPRHRYRRTCHPGPRCRCAGHGESRPAPGHATHCRWVRLMVSNPRQEPRPRAAPTRYLGTQACDGEDLLDQLNMTVYRQQQEIDSLLQQLALLRQQLSDPTGPQPGRNARDELPLHSCRFLCQSSYLASAARQALGHASPPRTGPACAPVFSTSVRGSSTGKAQPLPPRYIGSGPSEAP